MKITKEGWAVVEWDQLLSKYVEEQGRLDVALPTLDLVHQFIPEGGVVADVGACIGDHTITYSQWVGAQGKVHAFEPNPEAWECLIHNVDRFDIHNNVKLYHAALGAHHDIGSLSTAGQNLGATYVIVDLAGSVSICPLDYLATEWIRLDFLKIDAEGFEPYILDGAVKTIQRLRPVMLIEVNLEMLGGYSETAESIFSRVQMLDYVFPNCSQHAFDLLCVPR